MDSIPVRGGAVGGYTPMVLSNMVGINIHADAVVQWTTLRDLRLGPGAYRPLLTLNDSAGQPLGHNQFEFEVIPEKAKE
jgi:hypothetical protein